MQPNDLDVVLSVTNQLRLKYNKSFELVFIFSNETYQDKFIGDDDFISKLHYIMEQNNIDLIPIHQAKTERNIDISEDKVSLDKFVVIPIFQ
jgi:hypothetical protein